MSTRLLLAFGLALLVLSAGRLFAITCEECNEMDKKRANIQLELGIKEKELSTAFDKKEFTKVRDIRTTMTDLRKQLLDTKANEEKCKYACRADVVQQAKCAKLREEIVKVEEAPESEQDTAKVDALYKDLLRCDTEMKQLKKPGH
jgi:hypothetical protein